MPLAVKSSSVINAVKCSPPAPVGFRLQKYEEAVAAFSKVLKLDPFCLDGYIGRGNAYMEYGLEEATVRARKDFLKAIHLDPTCLKARLCLGYNLQVTVLSL